MQKYFWVRLAVACVLPVFVLALLQYPVWVSLLRPKITHVLPKLGPTVHPLKEVQVDNVFVYPSLSIQAHLIELPQTSPLVTQSWAAIRGALRQGVSLSYEGETFDAASLAFITGHSSDTYPHAYASIFAGLGQGHIGDIFSFRRQGKSYTYKVIDKKVISPQDTQSFLNLAPPANKPHRLALVTCWPVLTTKNRMMIVGELQP